MYYNYMKNKRTETSEKNTLIISKNNKKKIDVVSSFDCNDTASIEQTSCRCEN